MAKRKAKKRPTKKARKKTTRRKKSAVDMIISKSRTKAAAGINVSGDFYGALDSAVRNMINSAEKRALENKRKTLKPCDL